MLKAIAVDDEQMALMWFAEVAAQTDGISLAECFTSSQEALKYISEHEVDVVFLDIEMPGISGLELSESIFELRPAVDVVFVTAYDKYALQAFQAHAIGYLLKPIEPQAIAEQVQSILKRRNAGQARPAGNMLRVYCLGTFRCVPGTDDSAPIRWRTAKAEELFALLIHNRGDLVSKERILDTLWPAMVPEKAAKNLYATWYYLRDVLREKGYAGLLVRSRSGYQLKMAGLWCDSVEFAESMERIKKSGEVPETLEKAARLYQGAYFGDRAYEWAESMRSWIDSEYEKLAYGLARAYRLAGKAEKELETLKRLVFYNPLADDAYRLLIELCVRRQDYAAATGYYKKYEKVLSDELGISPPEYIRQMIKPQE